MSEEQIFDVCIVGGGIVGAATAYSFQQAYPDLKILLIEKENRPAPHQTGHNSGVIHSGIYYKPGSYKAKNCVSGKDQLIAFAKEHGIEHDVCGKVIVATDESEFPHMEKVFNNGIANGLTDNRWINADEIKEIEPHCTGIKGIWVPYTGIIDFVGTTAKMLEITEALNAETKVVFNEEVTSYTEESGVKSIRTNKASYKAKYMVFCGGLQADRLAKKDGVKLDMSIVGFRGDYYELTETAKHKVKNLIYPVPNPEFPFLGVHFTRMTDSSVECGPNAVFSFKREGYGKTDFSLKDTVEALAFKGTWNLLFNHFGFAYNEYRRAFSKRLFLKTLQRLIPDLKMEDLQPGRAGVRAMALGLDGETIDDFRIEQKGNSLHVLNAPSPAATASLAIGNQIREMAEERFALKDKISL
ncbi:MAG TPA: L-2-hydroxyglutarate oxidase [Flavobacteriales bacterium]|nr:L-2-hydroxyglutarate oxidase [Flavobacteriales bacterium]